MCHSNSSESHTSLQEKPQLSLGCPDNHFADTQPLEGEGGRKWGE